MRSTKPNTIAKKPISECFNSTVCSKTKAHNLYTKFIRPQSAWSTTAELGLS